MWVDLGGGNSQRYVEDCAICCRPCNVRIWGDGDGQLYATLTAQDD